MALPGPAGFRHLIWSPAGFGFLRPPLSRFAAAKRRSWRRSALIGKPAGSFVRSWGDSCRQKRSETEPCWTHPLVWGVQNGSMLWEAPQVAQETLQQATWMAPIRWAGAPCTWAMPFGGDGACDVRCVCVCVQVPYTIVELIPRCRIYETIVTGPSSDWKVSNVWEEFTSQWVQLDRRTFESWWEEPFKCFIMFFFAFLLL